MDKITNYYKLFGIENSDIKQLLDKALSKGGDYADIFFEHSIANNLVLQDGEVNSIGSHIDYGVGIRVVAKEKTGYAYSEKTNLKDMLVAANNAAQIASDNSTILSTPSSINLLNKTKIQGRVNNFYPILSPWETHSISEKIEYVKELGDLILSKDDKVIKAIVRLSDSNTKVLFFNSIGECFYDERPMASLVASCIMADQGHTENYTASKSFRQGFEFISHDMIQELAETAVKGCKFLFTAKQPTGGEMPVVMSSGSSGILLHEAIGHSFEADFNRKNTSIFSDKFGKQICIKEINIVDDATLPYNRGSINFDDEGTPGQKTYMVRDGVLTSYLHDRISANFYKVKPTGNGRRESFRYAPIPRMRATYMENGTAHEEDLIKDIKQGIYVDSFSNGQVQIGAGDFTFFVKTGYMIENGKLTQPIKDANIIGNGPQALADITAVANNSYVDNGTWTCGKGQYVPVSCGMPSVSIKKLIVGGTN